MLHAVRRQANKAPAGGAAAAAAAAKARMSALGSWRTFVKLLAIRVLLKDLKYIL